MNYNDVFCAQKKAEGRYNVDSDNLAKEILEDYNNYVRTLNTNAGTSNVRKHLFNGLVVGYVQSGKTMNFCHVINRAIDDGFQLVVVLSSNKNDLNMQTTDRLADDIVGYVNPSVPHITSISGHSRGWDFDTYYRNGNGVDTGIKLSSAVNPNITGIYPYSGVNIHTRTPNVYWLTACDKGNIGTRNVDFDINHGGGSESLDDYLRKDLNGCYVAVVKKNTHRLGLLYDFLSASNVVKQHKIKALFIDDECDEITVSGIGRKLGKSSVQIDAIQKLFETSALDTHHSMYVEYTATPVANICVKNRSNTSTGFPDDFIKVMKKGDAYCGFQEYRDYGAVTNVINPSQQNETANMVPLGCVSLAVYKSRTPVLYQALLQYILNCRIFDERFTGKSKAVTSMLVHTDRLQDIHSEEREYIEELLNVLSQELLQEMDDIYINYSGHYVKNGSWVLLDDIADTLDEIQHKMTTCNANGWYQRAPFTNCSVTAYPAQQQFTLDFCMELLQYAMRRMPNKTYHANIKFSWGNGKKIEVMEINSNSTNTLPTNKNYIAVGGNKLGRGLTLNNLSVTYFTRQTGAIDTFTQMARWFGYRIGYYDICRLFVDDYASLDKAYTVEKDLQTQIKIQNQKNIRSGNMHLVFAATVPMILSGKQVAASTMSASANTIFEVLNYYTNRGVTKNDAVLKDFFAKLQRAGYAPEAVGSFGCISVIANTQPHPGRHCFIKDVDVRFVYRYLFDKYCSVSNKQQTDIMLVIKKYLEMNHVTKVNVLLSGRDANANSGKGTSFANGLYAVSGLASKNAAINRNTYWEINPFDDCPEDYVVDYPNPATLNNDFNTFTNGAVYTNSRAAGYGPNVRAFGQLHRQIPLVIITPFELAASANIPGAAGTIYYSVKVVVPRSFSQTTFFII